MVCDVEGELGQEFVVVLVVGLVVGYIEVETGLAVDHSMLGVDRIELGVDTELAADLRLGFEVFAVAQNCFVVWDAEEADQNTNWHVLPARHTDFSLALPEKCMHSEEGRWRFVDVEMTPVPDPSDIDAKVVRMVEA